MISGVGTYGLYAYACAYAAALFVPIAALAIGQQQPPNVSKCVFVGDAQNQDQLAVLTSIPPPSGKGAPRTSALDLKIFAEDPHWAAKVEDFMVGEGEDQLGVESALDQVRHVSWAAGRTLRRKLVVLLAFAEDARSDGLTKAVLAASRHTSNADFVLVADGFELDMATRETVTASGRSVVAVLSTSFLLLPTTANGPSAPPTLNREYIRGSVNNDIGGGRIASDIFVAYERLRATTLPPPKGLNSTISGTASPRGETGEPDIRVDGREKRADSKGGRYDEYGRVHHHSNIGDKGKGLLVTASLSRERRRLDDEDVSTASDADGHRRVPAVEEEVKHAQDWSEEVNDLGRAYSTAGSLRAPSPPRQPLGMRLSDVAPLPLLVFDTETFLALGELDERFAFQGGVAEWINRAKLGSTHGGTSKNAGSDDYGGQASCRRHHRSNARTHATKGGGGSTGCSSSDGAVQHVHDYDWGIQYIVSWPEDDMDFDEAKQSRGSTTDQFLQNARHARGDPLSGVQRLGVDKNTFQHEGGGEDEFRRRDGFEDLHASGEVVIDQWHGLPPAKLEDLVQADADLFFLPLLLWEPSSEGAPNGEKDPKELCISFHSEWMGRSPNKRLAREALERRKRFPVAVVVVVHDDISLMRAVLEEVAAVVEHILVVVSVRPWHESATDVSPTLRMLECMLQDADSPTRGKLRVEVGSWATEPAQREYGNALIREDVRNFSRVVVIDTDEFWHPVELSKALVLAAQQYKVAFAQAEMDTYWASVRSVVSPPEKLQALWLVDPRRCVWHQHREVICDIELGEEHHTALRLQRNDAVVHHLSYVRVEEDIRRKMATFSHAGEEQSGWYERSWLGWATNHSLTDLHPVIPVAYKRVVPQPLFRLTPPLRALHLDAKKGRENIATTFNTPDERCTTPSSDGAAAVAGSANPTSGARVQRGVHRAENKLLDGTLDGTVDCFEDSIQGKAYSESGRQPSISAGEGADKKINGGSGSEDDSNGKGFRQGIRGCEATVFEEWTERQRTMCLIPNTGRTVSQ
ncbi:unnamed protein product [Ectocarpus sp. CCAP 1310/34]|nr:unnamed protein product [Ectocarpus sp. CCAP 1310/34]